MNINKKGISTSVVAMAVVLVIVVVAAAAIIAVGTGKTNTVTRTTTQTSTVTSLSTSVSTSVTTATSTPPTYYPLTLQAGGSTFVNPLMQEWATDFSLYTSGVVSINYQAVGSGSGITGIEANTYEFAGSDAPVAASSIPSSDSGYGPLLEIPETLGGVAIFYNVPGVTVSLNFTGPVLAKVFLGEITMWNDSAIAALNPGCHAGSTTCVLPGDIIQTVVRSDGSGTTYALTNYFSKVSTDWNTTIAAANSPSGCPCYGTKVPWPAFDKIAEKGSGGIADYVESNPYTLGYADSYYAFSNGLKAAAIQNQAGVFLVPSLTDIAAAASAFSAQVQANPTFTITNAPGAGSYPISTFTYILVWADQTNQQVGYDMAQFLWWIVSPTQGQTYGPILYYPSLPASVVAIDQSLIKEINYNGVPFIQT